MIGSYAIGTSDPVEPLIGSKPTAPSAGLEPIVNTGFDLADVPAPAIEALSGIARSKTPKISARGPRRPVHEPCDSCSLGLRRTRGIVPHLMFSSIRVVLAVGPAG